MRMILFLMLWLMAVRFCKLIKKKLLMSKSMTMKLLMLPNLKLTRTSLPECMTCVHIHKVVLFTSV